MSQNFRLKSDELRQNNPTKDDRIDDDVFYKTYHNNGNIREFMLTWPDGTSITVPYFSIVRKEFNSHDGSICMITGMDTLVFEGINLKALYHDFFFQLPLEIIICDARYNETNDETIFTVNRVNRLKQS